MARIDIPLPESVVRAEAESRRRSVEDQVRRLGGTMDDYLEATGGSAAGLDRQALTGRSPTRRPAR
jgi:FKBP-type peptidyl-prolyl cis-trans isomerase (trigger factor)